MMHLTINFHLTIYYLTINQIPDLPVCYLISRSNQLSELRIFNTRVQISIVQLVIIVPYVTSTSVFHQ